MKATTGSTEKFSDIHQSRGIRMTIVKLKIARLHLYRFTSVRVVREYP